MWIIYIGGRPEVLSDVSPFTSNLTREIHGTHGSNLRQNIKNGGEKNLGQFIHLEHISCCGKFCFTSKI